MTIVGVAQQGFTGEMPGDLPDLFVPIVMKKEMTPDWDGLADRRDYWVTMFGRLKPGRRSSRRGRDQRHLSRRSSSRTSRC